MDNIKLYEIDNAYVSYLLPFAPHLFKNKKPGQQNERKYIGVVLSINGMDYFAPLSSFKPKHVKMKDGLDFIKIKNYAVINLNNMFPVPRGVYHYVNIASIQDPQYKALLQAEYRFIKSVQDRIRKNASNLYAHKLQYGDETALAKRCNNFLALEKACQEYT